MWPKCMTIIIILTLIALVFIFYFPVEKFKHNETVSCSFCISLSAHAQRELTVCVCLYVSVCYLTICSTMTVLLAIHCVFSDFDMWTWKIRDCGSNLYVGMRVVEMF